MANLRQAVCIVNEAFVRRVLPGVDPIGKPCMLSRRPRLLSNASTHRSEQAYSIVGVVRDSRYANPGGATPPLIYTPFLQGNTGRGQMALHVRVRGSAQGIAQRIRQEVAVVDPTVPIFEVRTLQQEEMNAALSGGASSRSFPAFSGCWR